MKRDPKHLGARSSLAKMYRDKGLIEQAIREYDKIIEFYPANPLPHYSLGKIHLEQDNKNEALIKDNLLKDLEDQLNKSKEEKDSLSNFLKDKENQIDFLKNIEKQYSELQSKIETGSTESDEKNEKTDKLENKIKELESDNIEKRTQIIGLKENIDSRF